MKYLNVRGGNVVVCVILVACTTLPSAESLRERNSAVVRGYEVPFFKILFGSDEPRAELRIIAVDGQTKWHRHGGYATEVQLPAGPRRLTVLCSGQSDRKPFEYQVSLALDAGAGEIYQLDPHVRPDGCEVRVRKMAGKGR